MADLAFRFTDEETIFNWTQIMGIESYTNVCKFKLKRTTILAEILEYEYRIIVPIKLELAKYYKDFEMTAFISERSRNSK